ncbi:tripartite tricarboxylate transporter substrate binding protein [Microbacterium esteraromaticum]|uniref:Tripartite tricarboxylate transporter substrate binding protein n=1 Tax=Microbacterium esteraromaticum TaxID=57043 RepID=A0A939DSW8_9MICO|nr:tripartite tricarboxylate transporter substrate binding protein [Microbacterium esteraromaticum]MBN7794162.1 tripartite tricarboxylate transporter substrate binding protein [Microbacterium esteraromaticum]MBN8204550.1 tripartite tricarboxylate transporter substrate binding protein [Microbacterium esteraromaticum]MBN8414704.1 tripartite tricarboxylate transporter substrate binding protein [Microbacterium esteraromaticum]MCA1306762.1 tripartite tricarboxylate transporter substrate binding prot
MPRIRMTRATVAIATAAAAALVLAGCSPVEEGGDASSFPDKDIRLIIQANPGGGSDLSSRALASELENILDVSVIPENMPGAAGALAMEFVGAQEADGYVIGFAPVEIAMLNTTQGADVLPENYDLLGQIMLAPGVVTVGADSGIESLDDLVAQAEAGAVTVANSGAGSIWEAATLGLADATGAEFTPVAYDGGATAVGAAASGETVAAVSGLGEALAQGEAVRILAVMHDERHPDAADVPTVEEAIGEAVEFGGWGGIYAPKGLPDDVKATLESAVQQAVESDSYQAFQKDAGNLVVYRDSAEWTTFVGEQFDLFQELLG